jgi:hypothetical protein
VHAVAAGYTLVLHVALWLPVTLLGAWYMLRQSLTWRDMDRAAALRASGTAESDIAEPANPQKVLP